MPESTPLSGMPAAVPSALRDGHYQAVRTAWVEGCRLGDRQYPPLRTALERLALEARACGVSAAEVLRTLDTVCRRQAGGDEALDWDHVREWAGRVVIRAYYRDD
jgi:hypothetical protein